MQNVLEVDNLADYRTLHSSPHGRPSEMMFWLRSPLALALCTLGRTLLIKTFSTNSHADHVREDNYKITIEFRVSMVLCSFLQIRATTLHSRLIERNCYNVWDLHMPIKSILTIQNLNSPFASFRQQYIAVCVTYFYTSLLEPSTSARTLTIQWSLPTLGCSKLFPGIGYTNNLRPTACWHETVHFSPKRGAISQFSSDSRNRAPSSSAHRLHEPATR